MSVFAFRQKWHTAFLFEKDNPLQSGRRSWRAALLDHKTKSSHFGSREAGPGTQQHEQGCAVIQYSCMPSLFTVVLRPRTSCMTGQHLTRAMPQVAHTLQRSSKHLQKLSLLREKGQSRKKPQKHPKLKAQYTVLQCHWELPDTSTSDTPSTKSLAHFLLLNFFYFSNFIIFVLISMLQTNLEKDETINKIEISKTLTIRIL